MKMEMKKIIAVLLITALMAGGTGCMDEKQQNTSQKQDIQNLGISYMEEKYGEAFSYAEPAGNSFGNDTRKFLVTCDGLPGKLICVGVENIWADPLVFRDNYLSLKYEEQTVSYFQSLFEKEFGDVVVFYEVTLQCQAPTVAANFSFDEYLKDDSVEINVMVEIAKSRFSSRKQFETIFSQLEKDCNYAKVTAVVVEDNEFNNLSENDIMIKLAYKKYCFGVRAAFHAETSIEWLLEE